MAQWKKHTFILHMHEWVNEWMNDCPAAERPRWPACPIFIPSDQQLVASLTLFCWLLSTDVLMLEEVFTPFTETKLLSSTVSHSNVNNNNNLKKKQQHYALLIFPELQTWLHQRKRFARRLVRVQLCNATTRWHFHPNIQTILAKMRVTGPIKRQYSYSSSDSSSYTGRLKISEQSVRGSLNKQCQINNEGMWRENTTTTKSTAEVTAHKPDTLGFFFFFSAARRPARTVTPNLSRLPALY